MRNPTCDLRNYSGGQIACHHMWSLLDADQDIPWPQQPIEYSLKFRFWVEEYNKSYHTSLRRATWGIASPVEYDVPKCDHQVKGCSLVNGSWIHTISGTYEGEGILSAAHFHCHAPTCLSMAMYRCPPKTKVCNASSGELLCEQRPVYGNNSDRFSEPGYIFQPPCLWGSPEFGLAPPPSVGGYVLGTVKTSNASYGHHGEMAWQQMYIFDDPGSESYICPSLTFDRDRSASDFGSTFMELRELTGADARVEVRAGRHFSGALSCSLWEGTIGGPRGVAEVMNLALVRARPWAPLTQALKVPCLGSRLAQSSSLSALQMRRPSEPSRVSRARAMDPEAAMEEEWEESEESEAPIEFVKEQALTSLLRPKPRFDELPPLKARQLQASYGRGYSMLVQMGYTGGGPTPKCGVLRVARAGLQEDEAQVVDASAKRGLKRRLEKLSAEEPFAEIEEEEDDLDFDLCGLGRAVVRELRQTKDRKMSIPMLSKRPRVMRVLELWEVTNFERYLKQFVREDLPSYCLLTQSSGIALKKITNKTARFARACEEAWTVQLREPKERSLASDSTSPGSPTDSLYPEDWGVQIGEGWLAQQPAVQLAPLFGPSPD
ncbi:unnamed protein product [Effrenium voratum]|nr:unnamed protein product [Effrenium voratum]